MEISLEEVRNIFCEVLSGRMSREAANDWAYSIMQKSEAKSLIFVPRSEQERIWAGIMYLYGIDLMDKPGEYLHTDEDIKVEMQNKFGQSQVNVI